MKISVKRSLATVAVGTLLVGTLAACGSDSSDGSGSDTLVVGTTISIDKLDPLNLQYKTVQHNVFDGLVRVVDAEGTAEARLAEKWTQVDDTTWDFTLRQGVTFHDGSELTVDDVVFSFSTIMAEDSTSPLKPFLLGVTSVEATDDATVRITTATPDPLLLKIVSQISIVPQAVYTEMGSDAFAQAPVGTGPFTITKVEGDQRVTLEAYDGFWGEKAKTAKVEVAYFSDATSLSSAFESGQVHVAHELNATALQTLGTNDAYELSNVYGGNQNMLTFNSTSGVFADEAVREAANQAIDADALIDALTAGAGVREDGQLPIDGIFGYTDTIERPAFDLDAAKAAVKAAGAEGAKIEIAGPSLYKQLLEAVAAQLADAGFEPTVNAMEVGQWLPQLREGSTSDIFYKGVSDTGFFDADRSLSQLARGTKKMVDDKKFDELYAAQRSEFDVEKRAAAIAEASQYVNEKDFVLWTYGRPSVSATTEDVTGLDFSTGLMLLLDDAVKN